MKPKKPHILTQKELHACLEMNLALNRALGDEAQALAEKKHGKKPEVKRVEHWADSEEGRTRYRDGEPTATVFVKDLEAHDAFLEEQAQKCEARAALLKKQYSWHEKERLAENVMVEVRFLLKVAAALRSKAKEGTK